MSYLTVQIIKIWHCFSRFSQINPVTSLVLCTNPGHSHDHAVKSHVWYHRNMSSNGIILDITMIVIKHNGHKIQQCTLFTLHYHIMFGSYREQFQIVWLSSATHVKSQIHFFYIIRFLKFRYSTTKTRYFKTFKAWLIDLINYLIENVPDYGPYL